MSDRCVGRSSKFQSERVKQQRQRLISGTVVLISGTVVPAFPCLSSVFVDYSTRSLLRVPSSGSPIEHVYCQVGNCYTASVFAGLVSVVAGKGSSLEEDGGARILMFSYGSGFIATAYRWEMGVRGALVLGSQSPCGTGVRR